MSTLTPPALDPSSASTSIVGSDRACIKCGYNLRGLAISGKCPECGANVADSLKGELLQFATPEYIATIRQGVSLVLNAILLSIVLMVIAMIIAFAAAGNKMAGAFVQTAVLIPAIMSFLGYLKFTEPDPGFTGIEKPDSARQVVRIAAIVQIVIALLSAALQFGTAFSPSIAGSAPGGSSASVATGGLVLLASLASMAAAAVQFFGSMRYVRWLAARIPDQIIVKKTKTYMWLLPVLTTVGLLLLGFGPLIALVLFWNLLDRLRKHLTSIRDNGVPAQLKGMAA